MQGFFASRAAIGNTIVAVVMVVIVAVWMVQVRSTVVALGGDVQQGVQSSSKFFNDTWQDVKKSPSPLVATNIADDGAAIDQVLSAVAAEINRGDTAIATQDTGMADSAPVALPVSSDRRAVNALPNGSKTTIDACTRSGGIYVQRTVSEGAQKYGVCMFNDGSECEAVLFASGECHAGQHARAQPTRQ